MRPLAAIITLILATAPVIAEGDPVPFAIRMIDEDTGRGIPLVELETIHNLRYITDSNGIAAIHAPELLNQEVFFQIRSHGYEYPKDGFGYRGKKLTVTPGSSATLKIKRLNIAERLYRITGAGIYADSVMTGAVVPVQQPLLNARVFGQDSVHTALYEEKIFWLWGDTNRPSYPLGNFHVTAATSLLSALGGLDPDKGIDLTYFVHEESGFAREMARLPGKGPTWLSALTTLKDKTGAERLVAAYMKVKPPLAVYERGLVTFNPETESFERTLTFEKDAKLYPHGHPFPHTVDGRDYLYFGNAFPHIRIPATYEAWNDPATYQPVAADVAFIDPDTGNVIKTHAGRVAWNPYLDKWIAIFCQSGGTSSALGEIWFASADAPEGPWRHAVKILTHDDYSFYNPCHHPFLNQDNGRLIYFEGTYTNMFSGNPDQTPRYNYNQIMYRLDLSDSRLTNE